MAKQETETIKEATQTIVQRFADDVPVTIHDLALALRQSRFTVYRWKRKGYKFQYGPLTTPGHCKAWLTENADKLIRKPPTKKRCDEDARLEAKLAELT